MCYTANVPWQSPVRNLHFWGPVVVTGFTVPGLWQALRYQRIFVEERQWKSLSFPGYSISSYFFPGAILASENPWIFKDFSWQISANLKKRFFLWLFHNKVLKRRQRSGKQKWEVNPWLQRISKDYIAKIPVQCIWIGLEVLLFRFVRYQYHFARHPL